MLALWRRQQEWIIVVIAGLGLVRFAAEARATECATDDFNSSIKTTVGNIDWLIWFDKNGSKPLDCLKAGDWISAMQANAVAGGVATAYARHTVDWNFPAPWASTLPDFDIVIFDTGSSYSRACINLDAPWFRCQSPAGILHTLGHEMFHAIQSRYAFNGGADGKTGSYGRWLIEGTARCLDDRYDSSGISEGGGQYYREANAFLATFADNSLLDESYRVCLFWSYCCEQLAYTGVEPDAGVGFINALWQRVQVDLGNGVKDGLAHTDRAIKDSGGPGLDKLYHDFATCLYTRGFTVSALPNWPKYRFIDETPAGGGTPYSNVKLTATYCDCVPGSWSGSGTVPIYGQRVYRLVLLDPPDGCEAVGFRGSAKQPLAWSLVGTKAGTLPGNPGRAVILSKQVGKEYGAAFLNSVADPLLTLGGMAIGLGNGGGDFDYSFDSGPVTVSIIRPNTAHFAHPGRFDELGRFVVRVLVDGPAALKPPGAGSISVKGLRKQDFGVKVGTEEARILSAGYSGGEYHLVVEAPEQPANGYYSLEVCLCRGVPEAVADTQSNAVLYGDYTINHMVVFDRSGSMGYPTTGGSKMDAAKNAGTLYLDAVNDDDRVGVVIFGDSDPFCNDNAFTILGLGDAGPVHRGLGKSAIIAEAAFGGTSIGDGLWLAQDEFDNFPGGLDPEDLEFMLLLSDGAENVPRFWGHADASCSGNAGDAVIGRIVPSSTRVTAYAFGPEANQELMQEIGDLTLGDWGYIDVTGLGASASSLARIAPPQTEGAGGGLSMVSHLADAYMKQIQRTRGLERLFFASGNVDAATAHSFDIPVTEGGVDEGTFFFNWSSSAGNVVVELRDPGNTLITAAQATVYSEPTHVVYHVPGTLATGTWTATLTPNNATEFIAGLLGKQRLGVQIFTRVGQVTTTGGNQGKYEQGVPVTVMSILTDSLGPVLGADFSATVRRPDGTPACGTLVLRDDGTQNDGEADDGVYAAIFTDTSQAGSIVGTDNDNPPGNPGGTPGAYVVDLTAAGVGNQDQAFVRYDTVAFHVHVGDVNDVEPDGLPDTWETFYGATVGVDDAEEDPDADGLINIDEYRNGANPFDPDTDDGGENDLSEVTHGRCPIDPVDDQLPCPTDVGVVSDPGDTDSSILMPLANLLYFPVHPAYERMHIFRAGPADLTNFALLADVPINEINDGLYYDQGLADGATYAYKFEAVGAVEALSCVSRTVTGTARANPVPPFGWADINTQSERTDRTQVLVTLDLTTGADKFRISNDPIDGSEPLIDLPASPYLNWILTSPDPGRQAFVYVQYVNSAAGTTSTLVGDDVTYDPDGDFDGDGMINSTDPDDDGDGLDDFDEVFLYHTDAFNVDSDADGLTDAEEVTTTCTRPRNPDTDGDGILDGADPTPVLLKTRLVGADVVAGDHFGASVGMSGDVMVVGASADEGGPAGSAYVYARTGAEWAEAAKLTASAPSAGDRFGWSVSADGDVVVVGAYGETGGGGGTNLGAAYVYRFNESGWVEEQRLTASDAAAGDSFGFAVAVSGDVVVVGADGDDDGGSASGSAYVFRYDDVGGQWNQEDKLTASDAAADDNFGSAVAVIGGVAVIGATGQDLGDPFPSTGAAYVFRFSGAGWDEEQQLTASDAAAKDAFGTSVAVDGDVVLVGADGDDDLASASGAAYVYRYDLDVNMWNEEDKLTASDGSSLGNFGESVAIVGDMAVVGAQQLTLGPGAAYVYQYAPGTAPEWDEKAKLTACDPGFDNRFGAAVGYNGDTAVVGAWKVGCPSGNDCGSAYIFGGIADCNHNGQLDVDGILAGTAQDGDGDGILIVCDPSELRSIPTVSHWQLIVMSLLVLGAGAGSVRRRGRTVTSSAAR